MKYIIDDNDKNKHEALDKAETLAAIQQIIEEGEIPSELINGVALTLRNPLDNQDYKIAFCTQAKYNELEAQGQLESNCYYYITDDTSWDDLVAYVENLITSLTSDLDNRVTALETYPIDIPIDSTNPRIVNINAYGTGLYLILVRHNSGVSPTPHYTVLLSIDEINGAVESYVYDSSAKIFNATGRYLPSNPTYSRITIGGFSGSEANWSIVSCRQLIKY